MVVIGPTVLCFGPASLLVVVDTSERWLDLDRVELKEAWVKVLPILNSDVDVSVSKSPGERFSKVSCPAESVVPGGEVGKVIVVGFWKEEVRIVKVER